MKGELPHSFREMERLKAETARNRQIDEILRRAQRVDVCFLIDCTDSMGPYIIEAKQRIHGIVRGIKEICSNFDLRIAFVGYRDFCDNDNRLATLPFTKNVDEFVKFVSEQRAAGGGDGPEDVFGGLDAVLGLDWQADTRVLIHIADFPCHGQRFHPVFANLWDSPGQELDSDGKDKNGLSAESLIARLIPTGIAYHFYHACRNNTERMIDEFNKIASESGYVIAETDLRTAGLLQTFAVLSVTRSIADSAQDFCRRPAGGTKFETIEEEEEDDLEFIPRPPKWKSVDQEVACATWYDIPGSVGVLRPGMELHKMKTTITLQVAANPFSEGHMRRAFHARFIEGKWGLLQKAVVKKFKRSRDFSITACEAQMEAQCIAQYLANVFNGKLKSKFPCCFKWPTVDFLMAWSIQIEDRSSSFYANMEPFLEGEFEKFNSNVGCVYGCHDVLQAFSHWTHHVTKGYLMVVDLQGVRIGSNYILTDPSIHCKELVRLTPNIHNQFGDTNLGEQGMQQFFATHKCNRVCRKLRLPRTKSSQ